MDSFTVVIGGIYRIKTEKAHRCGSFQGHVYDPDPKFQSKYIQVTARGIDGLGYDILNENKEKCNYCNCYEEEDLLPLEQAIPDKKEKIEYVVLYENTGKTYFETMKTKPEFVAWIKKQKMVEKSTMRIIKNGGELRLSNFIKGGI